MNLRIVKNRLDFSIRFLLTMCLLFTALGLKAQDKVVSGKIIEQSGLTLPGVSVQNKTTNKGAISDANGNYRIDAKVGDQLQFSYLGYETQMIKVGDANIINVTLQSDAKALNEVVVIGYGTQKKSNLSGAVSTFKADNLDERPVGRVDQAMVGQMAGVTVKQTTGLPGKGLSIQVRGTGSISAGSEPL